MGSRSNKGDNKGTNRASAATDQIAEAEAAVTDRFGRVRKDKLAEEIAKGRVIKGLTSASGPVRQKFERTPLGRLNIDPSMIGRSDLP